MHMRIKKKPYKRYKKKSKGTVLNIIVCFHKRIIRNGNLSKEKKKKLDLLYMRCRAIHNMQNAGVMNSIIGYVYICNFGFGF